MTYTTNTLKVDGAELYYEVRGSGPVLLLICGGVYDAAGYAGLAGQLADRYTVVTYDRRGNSRSPLDGPPELQHIEVHGDDAHRVLNAVGEPAYVFGNSSGAIIGMELAARHPEQVLALVVHEPPLFELLPDRAYWRTVIQEIEETFAKEGPGAAGQILTTAFEKSGGGADDEDRIPGGAEAPQELDAETMAMMARFEQNFGFFIGYEVPSFAKYVPDLAALQRVVVAIGDATKQGEPQYQGALVLAERLGTEPVVFPGDHGGFGTEAEPFARRLSELLSGVSSR
jgi:pimeloyl-ACP methyl ester carboxylesterase